jgi:pentose-5-phosphate-3-epimerase
MPDEAARGAKRSTWLRTVRANISTHGRHITLVQGGPLPRYAYTIGAAEAAGAELVLAGAAYFKADDVGRILNGAVHALETAGRKGTVTLPAFGVLLAARP